jgi:excisionase family DNA binding protein
MATKTMKNTKTYELLSGEILDLSWLSQANLQYLQKLTNDAMEGADYFNLLRRVKGPEAPLLRGGRITKAVVRSAVYRASHDIADRAGIEQGYLLAPDIERPATLGPTETLLSLTEAAELIGISRPATHQALVEGRLPGQKVGNAWIVTKADAEAFKRNRSTRREKGIMLEIAQLPKYRSSGSR